MLSFTPILWTSRPVSRSETEQILTYMRGGVSQPETWWHIKRCTPCGCGRGSTNQFNRSRSAAQNSSELLFPQLNRWTVSVKSLNPSISDWVQRSASGSNSQTLSTTIQTKSQGNKLNSHCMLVQKLILVCNRISTRAAYNNLWIHTEMST